MADEKISGVPAVVTPAGTDQYATNQGGVSKSTTLSQILGEVPTAGDVFKVGVPAIDQIGVWTGDGTIKGFAGFKFDGSQLLLPNYSFPNADGAADQVLVTDGLGVLSFKDQASGGGGLLSATYLFDTDITAADPGPGNVRFNNATPASVTEIFIDAIDENAVDVTNILGLITTDDRIYIQTKEDASEFLVLNVTAPITDNTGWFTITGTVEASGGLPADGEPALVILQIGGAASGGGDVFKVGTPANNQLGVWTGDGTIEGDTSWQVVGSALQGVGGSSPELRNVGGVNIHPRKGDTDTGLSSGGDNRLQMVAQGVVGIKLIGASTAILQVHDTTVGLTAFAGGGQGSATQLNSSYSIISTVATTGDSVKFSTTLEVGLVNYVKNDGANAMDLFPAGGDDLGQGVGVAVSVPAGASVAFIGTVTGSVSTQFIFPEAGASFPLLAPDGTAGAPSYSFASDPDTGIFLSGPTSMEIALAGVSHFEFTSTSFGGKIAGGPRLVDELATAINPTLIPNKSDTDTGIGWGGADILSLIAGGVELGRLSALGDALFVAGSDGSGNGGTFTLRAGASGGSSTKGGSIVIEATNGAGGGAEGGDISLLCGNASGSGDDGGDFLAMGGNGVGGGGDGGTAILEAGRSLGGGIGGIAETKGGVGGNGANTGGIGRVIGGVGGDNGGSGGDAEVTGGPGVSAASDGDGGDAVINGGLGAGAGVDGDIIFNQAGATQFLITDGPNAEFQGFGFAGPAIRNRPTAGTIPTLCPNKEDLDTGVGGAQDDAVALVSGGVLAVRYSENSGGIIEAPFADLSITAFAAGGQGGLVLLSTNNVITTAASPGASVTLPPTFQVNSLVFIKNNGANVVDVFPSSGDDLGLGVNVAASLPVGKSISFIGTVQTTTWAEWIVDTPPLVVQTSSTADSAVATGTGLIPVDDTIPQITEGDEYMTLVHTPLDAANILIITIGMYLEGNSRMSIGLFEGVAANALSAVNTRGDDGDAKFMYMRHQLVAGGTAAITFRVRAGSSTAGTTTFNGISGSRIFGGVMASQISIIEVTP